MGRSRPEKPKPENRPICQLSSHRLPEDRKVQIACGAVNRDPISRAEAPVRFVTFGLLHGFGFTDVLVNLGLPGGDIPLAFLSFNVSVIFIAATLVAFAATRRIFILPHEAVVVASTYVIGTVAAFCALKRLKVHFLVRGVSDACI
jgi:hypothetical protein